MIGISNRSCPHEFNASIDSVSKSQSQVDVFAPSTVLITQNAKLLPGESGFRIIQSPHMSPSLKGELWSVYFEDFGEFDGVITAPHCICNFLQLSGLRWSRGFEAFLLELDGLFRLHSQYQDTLNTDDLTKQGPMESVAMAALFYFPWNILSSAAELKPLKRVEVYAVHVLESLRVAPNRFQGAEGT